MPSDNKLNCPTREELLIQIQIREEKESDKVKGILGNPSRVKYVFHVYWLFLFFYVLLLLSSNITQFF